MPHTTHVPFFGHSNFGHSHQNSTSISPAHTQWSVYACMNYEHSGSSHHITSFQWKSIVTIKSSMSNNDVVALMVADTGTKVCSHSDLLQREIYANEYCASKKIKACLTTQTHLEMFSVSFWYNAWREMAAYRLPFRNCANNRNPQYGK